MEEVLAENMTAMTLIPSGFKPSPLGPIPQDWEVRKLIEITDKNKKWSFTGGPFGSNLKSSDYTEYGVRIIQLQNIGDGEFLDDYKLYTSKEKADELLSCNIYSGEIIMSKMGDPVARACFIPNNGERFLMASDGIRLAVDEMKYQKKYIHDFINFEIFRKKAIESSTGSTRQRIGLDELRNLELIIPPLSEQTAIANCFSTWDKAIQSTTQLIAQKEKRKKWLTQQLLTGKKRLSGFTGDWRLVKMNTIAKEVSIKNSKDKDLTVLSCTKYDGLVPSLEYFGRKIFADDLTTYKIVPRNHFAYATNHIEEGSIGYQYMLDEGLTSPMYTVFKTDGTINDDFLFRLLKTHNYILEYQKRMEGSIDRRGGLRWDEFSKIRIPLLSLEEQSAIAQILQVSDREIQTLKAKLDKLKEQKKGLMQILLTGKKRLKF